MSINDLQKGGKGRRARLRTAVVACRVLEPELRRIIGNYPNILSLEFLEMGLHDQPGKLTSALQEKIDAIEKNDAAEAIALVYGLCSRGLENLSTHRCLLVVARAHDCITLFLGSKERYAKEIKEHPGTYWYSPGWNREHRVPSEEHYANLHATYCRKYGKDSADYLVDLEKESLKNYDRAAFVDLGNGGTEKERAYARDAADWLGWRYEEIAGDAALLDALLKGDWDEERFLLLQPGQKIAYSPGPEIIKASRCDACRDSRKGK